MIVSCTDSGLDTPMLEKWYQRRSIRRLFWSIQQCIGTCSNYHNVILYARRFRTNGEFRGDSTVHNERKYYLQHSICYLPSIVLRYHRSHTYVPCIARLGSICEGLWFMTLSNLVRPAIRFCRFIISVKITINLKKNSKKCARTICLLKNHTHLKWLNYIQ